jgi:ATP-binding cassette subfamily B protein
MVDCQSDSPEMDYDKLEAAITEKTKAVVPVDLAGIMCDYARIFEVLDTVPDVADGSADALPAPRGSVEFHGVSFKYAAGGTGEDVLKNISFSLRPGEFVAVVGGTGTGKSSLVNLIPRFYDVTEGSVLVDGMDVRDYPLEALRSRIGMVLQKNVLFSGTIRENLLWGRGDATEEEMIQAAKNAQAYNFIMSFPDGFDTRLEQGGVNLSGGQKQRLCIARAMLRNPSILILDDSTSAVDSATEALIRESFRTNLKGTTVIIIAQRISSVIHADKIVVLDRGEVVGIGSHEELMAGNRIYQEIYWSQQEGVSE